MSRHEDRPETNEEPQAAAESKPARRRRTDRGVWTGVSDETLEKFLKEMKTRLRESKARGEQTPPRRSLEGLCFGSAFNPPSDWLRETERRMRAAHAAKLKSEASTEHEENEDA